MRLLAILLAVFMLLLPLGCNGQADEITASLGQEVELKIGQTVSIEAEQIKINFSEVVNDSRCPNGATCIWQGEVTCILEITYLDSTYEKTIIQPGLTQEPGEDVFQEYRLTFSVEPYPELEEDIKTGDYRLQLTISYH